MGRDDEYMIVISDLYLTCDVTTETDCLLRSWTSYGIMPSSPKMALSSLVNAAPCQSFVIVVVVVVAEMR